MTKNAILYSATSFLLMGESDLSKSLIICVGEKMYSGKKRQTTRKALIITNETRKIGFIHMSKNGRRHDKRLIDKVERIRYIPPEVTIWADTGFQGIDKKHPNTQIPKKGTRKDLYRLNKNKKIK